MYHAFKGSLVSQEMLQFLRMATSSRWGSNVSLQAFQNCPSLMQLKSHLQQHMKFQLMSHNFLQFIEIEKLPKIFQCYDGLGKQISESCALCSYSYRLISRLAHRLSFYPFINKMTVFHQQPLQNEPSSRFSNSKRLSGIDLLYCSCRSNTLLCWDYSPMAVLANGCAVRLEVAQPQFPFLGGLQLIYCIAWVTSAVYISGILVYILLRLDFIGRGTS